MKNPKSSLFSERWLANQAFYGRDLLMHEPENLMAKLHKQERQFLSSFFWHYLRTDREEPIESDLDEMLAFFSFAFLQRRRSHAQILQDLWILYKTSEKHGGYFVEFGACDGHALSNTLLLEKGYGWTGLLAEPNPTWHAALDANRTAAISKKCVHHVTGERIEFSCSTIPELSRIADLVPNDIHERNGNRQEAERVEVETVTLHDLLLEVDAPNRIDYLSVDTEGSELEILSAFDFSSFRFDFMTIEHSGEEKRRQELYDLLTGHGYQRWLPEVSLWDDWYIHEGALKA